MIMLDSKDSSDSNSNATSYENQTPAVKKTSPKKEEEISIEDIPF
jgi:hypothetical protein